MHKFKSIILIDDDEDTLTLLKYWVAREKVASHVHTFNNGSDASEFIKTVSQSGNEHWPSLVMVDIYLPGLNGFDFLKELISLSQVNPKPKIFIVTGSENLKDIKNAALYDVDAFIKKPLSQKKLTKLLSRIAS